MWKFSILVLLLAATSKSLAQLPDYPIQCVFQIEPSRQRYGCFLTNLELLLNNVNIVFEGEHMPGYTDADVVLVDITDSMTPFIIPSIFTQFSNLEFLRIYRSSLQYLELPDTDQLLELEIVGGLINRLENSTFAGQRRLERLDLHDNQIMEIEEEAFAGLDFLFHLTLHTNQITRIPRLPPSVSWVEFQSNNLTRIEASSFADTIEVEFLFLQNNRIVEVEGTFAETFRDSILLVNMNGNLCSSRLFPDFNDDRAAEFDFFNMALSNCYNNFLAGPDGLRRVTLNVEGPMSFFDEFGNLVLRVN